MLCFRVSGTLAWQELEKCVSDALCLYRPNAVFCCITVAMKSLNHVITQEA